MGLDVGTIASWGSRLVGAERALIGAAPATDEASRLIGAVADEVTDTADSLGTGFGDRANVSALEGISTVLRATAGGLDDANAAIWNLRTAGDSLRSLSRMIDLPQGGAASVGGPPGMAGVGSFDGPGFLGGGAAGL